jgi:AmmeMemoRadiSam system protein A
VNPAARTVAEPDGSALASRAAAAVAARLAGRPPDGRLPGAPSLRAVGATFVTLERHGALLGCIGTLDAARPRYVDAMRNAVRAAADPRLPPVTAAQWPAVDVIVSVLTEPERLDARCPADLLPLLRPHTDGLILVDGDRRATFLPSVWRKISEPEQFLAALLHKGGWARGRRTDAGMSGRDWPADLTALRYSTLEFADRGPRPPPDGDI